MLFEIKLYVEQEMRGRVPTSRKIIAVVENGVEREPKSTDFIVALDHIMNKTDLIPVKAERVSGRKSDVRQTWAYTYQKPNVYIQTRYNKWAVAYEKDGSWWVHKAGKGVLTRFSTKTQSMADVDSYVGYDYIHELRKEGMVGSGEGIRRKAAQYLSAEEERANRRPSGERLQKQAEQDTEDLFG